MTRRAQWAVVGAALVGLAGSALFAARLLGGGSNAATVGAQMPDFAAHTLDVPAVPKHFSDYRGRVVLVNIWATYCVPCQAEMPSLERLSRELGPRGLVVVGVSIDNPGLEPQIREFVKEYGLTFPILQEGTGHIEEQLDAFGIPATFVVSKDGMIRRKVIGAQKWDTPDNRAMVERLLAE